MNAMSRMSPPHPGHSNDGSVADLVYIDTFRLDAG
jgi:hypothetical protein